MSIIRGPRPEGNFYILDKKISEDKRLSWASRGLLIYLLGKPNHWQVSVQALVNETKASTKPTGRDGAWSLLRELIEAGYCTRHQARKADGTLSEMDYTISEDSIAHPLTDAPRTAYPGTAEPGTANPTQVSIEEKQGLKKKTTARSCVLPDDFNPDDTGAALAASLGVNADDELTAFKDHHAANGSTFTDWQAAFRTWTRNAAKFAKRDRRNSPPAVNRPQAESFAERDARNGRERWEAMTGRTWPADELPGANPAAPFVIDIEANEPRRIS